MKYTDLVLLDLKQFDADKHKSLTGYDNQNILSFATYLSDKKKPMWVRFVLVPGITDNLEDVQKLKTFLNTLKNVVKVEVLPYHNMGEKKYAEIGMEYRLRGVKSPDPDLVAKISDILKGDCK